MTPCTAPSTCPLACPCPHPARPLPSPLPRPSPSPPRWPRCHCRLTGWATTLSAPAAAADGMQQLVEAATELSAAERPTAVHDRRPEDAALACSTIPPAAPPPRRSLPAAADSDGAACVPRPATAAMATAVAYSARAPHAVMAAAASPFFPAFPPPRSSAVPCRAGLTMTSLAAAAAHGRQAVRSCQCDARCRAGSCSAGLTARRCCADPVVHAACSAWPTPLVIACSRCGQR